jgi:hypothetical protein
MADVHASNQAAAASGGGGKGGGGDDGKRLVPPGKAHYNDDDSLEEIWSEIFNFSSGSAGMRKKHSRCVRCGREVGEHHRQNWQSQECTCVLCGTNGHIGKVCPLMQEHREFFNKAWVRSALKGYRGVRKGELPPPLTSREVKSRREAGFEEQRERNADAAAQTQQNVFNPMGMAMGQMASQMLMGMGMGMHGACLYLWSLWAWALLQCHPSRHQLLLSSVALLLPPLPSSNRAATAVVAVAVTGVVADAVDGVVAVVAVDDGCPTLSWTQP